MMRVITDFTLFPQFTSAFISLGLHSSLAIISPFLDKIFLFPFLFSSFICLFSLQNLDVHIDYFIYRFRSYRCCFCFLLIILLFVCNSPQHHLLLSFFLLLYVVFVIIFYMLILFFLLVLYAVYIPLLLHVFSSLSS